MPTPTNSSYGATCTKVVLQDHLCFTSTEQDGSNTTTLFHIIEWDGKATVTDCEGCTDGTNTAPLWGEALAGISPDRLVRRLQIDHLDKNTRRAFQQRTEYSDNLTTPTNPLKAQPVIEWDFSESGEKPYFFDNNPTGNSSSGGTAVHPGPQPCLNSAFERFQEFLQRAQGSVSATYSVNVPVTGSAPGYGSSTVTAFNRSEAQMYIAGGSNQSTPAVNNDSFTFDSFTIAAGQARAKGCTCSGVQTQNGVKFRVKKWTLLFKNNWLDVIEDRGFNSLVTGEFGKSLQPISNGTTSQQTQTPWPLDGAGNAKPNITDQPALLTFWPYQQLAFIPLGFT